MLPAAVPQKQHFESPDGGVQFASTVQASMCQAGGLQPSRFNFRDGLVYYGEQERRAARARACCCAAQPVLCCRVRGGCCPGCCGLAPRQAADDAVHGLHSMHANTTRGRTLAKVHVQPSTASLQ